MGGGRDRASRPTSKLSRTLPRGARGAATSVRGAQAAELIAQLWAVSPEAAPPPPARPPRQWQPNDRAHQRIIAARDIFVDTLRPRGGGGGGRRAVTAVGRVDLPVLALRPPLRCRRPFPSRVPPTHWGRSVTPAGWSDRARALSQAGIPDPRRVQCPSPTASGTSVPLNLLPAPSDPESPCVGRVRRRRGTLPRTPPPGRRQRLTCPSGQSGCPGRP